MTSIYAGSKAALVLDAELRDLHTNLEFNDVSENIILQAYALYCGWSTRSWTFQEGNLPPHTFFATRNHVLRVSQAHDWKSSIALNMSRQLRTMNDAYYPSKLRNFQSISTGAVWNALLDRTSTSPESEGLILAISLGISPYGLGDSPQAKWIPTLIRSHYDLPIAILYNTGPRMHAVMERKPSTGQVGKLQLLKKALRLAQTHLSTQIRPVESELTSLVDVVVHARNRWIPSSIAGDYYAPNELGRVANRSGRLYLKNALPTSMVLIVRNQCIKEKVFYLSYPIATIGAVGYLRIERFYQPGDHLVENMLNAGQDRCFIMPPTSSAERIRGAELRVVNERKRLWRIQSDLETSFAYPLRIATTLLGDLEDAPKYAAELCTPHDIEMIYSKSDFKQSL